MEPLVTIEGYEALQSQQISRDLLSDYYRTQGYEIVSAGTSLHQEEQDSARNKKEDVAENAHP
jgi:hypothetical protein